MKIHQSWMGAIFAAIYLLFAVFIAYDAYGCSGGSFPLSCDFVLALVIFPMMPLIALLEELGFAEPNFSKPGPDASDVLMVTLYILVCALFAYLLGYGIEKFFRYMAAKQDKPVVKDEP